MAQRALGRDSEGVMSRLRHALVWAVVGLLALMLVATLVLEGTA